MLLRFAADECTHPFRYAALLVAQHGPAVNPAAGRQRQYTAYAATVLEHDTIPVAIGRVDDGALSQMRESAKVRLQDDLFLVRSTDVVGTVAHLTAMTSRRIDVGNHQEVVASVVFNHARALQQSTLVGLALEELVVRPLDDVGEVGLQFHHFARAIDDIDAVVVVEE